MWACQESASGFTKELRNSPSVATVESTMSTSSSRLPDLRMAQNACSFARSHSEALGSAA